MCILQIWSKANFYGDFFIMATVLSAVSCLMGSNFISCHLFQISILAVSSLMSSILLVATYFLFPFLFRDPCFRHHSSLCEFIYYGEEVVVDDSFYHINVSYSSLISVSVSVKLRFQICWTKISHFYCQSQLHTMFLILLPFCTLSIPESTCSIFDCRGFPIVADYLALSLSLSFNHHYML